MKKVLSILLVVFMLMQTLTLFACTGSGQTITTTKQETPEEPSVHVHNYVSVATNPTCTEQGYTTYTCECGKDYIDNYTNPLGHRFSDWENIKEATNTEDGLRERRCECGLVEQEVIKATNSEHYIIYRNLKDAAYPEPNGYESKNGLLDLPQPEATGYKFIGWYTASIGGDLVDYIPKGSDTDYILYAHWEIITYDIIYKKVPNNTNPTSYDIEDKLKLENPKWSGLVFTHWSDEDGNIYKPNENITIFPEKMSGDLILTANWKVLRNIATPAEYGAELFNTYDGADGFLYFFYDIGTIEHVVLDDIDPNLYYKSEGMPLNLTLSKTVAISEETASSISNTVSKSISTSVGWEGTKTWAETNTDKWNSQIGGGIEGGFGSSDAWTKALGFSVKAKVEGFYNWGEEDSVTNGWTNSKHGSLDSDITNTEEITTSIAYKQQISSEISENFSINADLPSGYYAYVHAGNVRVIAVVSYEIATGCLYLSTYSRLDNMHSMIMYYENVNQLNNPKVEGLDFTIPEREIVDFINSSYFVIYDANGGVGTMPSSIYSVNGEQNLATNIYTKKGYEFIGWNTEPDGSGTNYNDEAAINNLVDGGHTITLYAMWEIKTSKGLQYTLNNDKKGYSVTGIGSCTDTDIVIPHTYNSLPVTSIANSAFRNCTSLIKIDIPDSVTSIGEATFYNCKSLASVAIPNSVTSIGDFAFKNCTSLTSIIIPDSITSVGEQAFYNCISLPFNNYDNSLYLGNEKNPYYALIIAKDTSITSCDIHEDAEIIANRAFNDCTLLTSIEIPDSVKSIGREAFRDCSALTTIEIPDSVASIGVAAFYSCRSLKSVSIPDSVTSIGEWAFYDCTALTSIETLGSITSIDNYVFNNCISLTNITIPDSVISIGYQAFYNCTSLTQVEYKGTIEQWNAITFGYYWNDSVPATKVVCSNGTVSLK